MQSREERRMESKMERSAESKLDSEKLLQGF
jgi:hypothetical protein